MLCVMRYNQHYKHAVARAASAGGNHWTSCASLLHMDSAAACCSAVASRTATAVSLTAGIHIHTYMHPDTCMGLRHVYLSISYRTSWSACGGTCCKMRACWSRMLANVAEQQTIWPPLGHSETALARSMTAPMYSRRFVSSCTCNSQHHCSALAGTVQHRNQSFN